jgi:hypothetical protein
MENTTLDEKATANTGLKWGGYAGAAYVLITYFVFTIVKDGRCITWPIGFLPYVAVIIAMFFAAFEKRKLMGGYITFRVAFSNTFLVLIMSVIAFGIFYYFLFHTIAPTLNISVKNLQLAAIEKMLIALKTPADKMDEMMMPYRSDDYIMTFQRVLMETIFSIPKGFFWAAMVALIVRKKQPTV